MRDLIADRRLMNTVECFLLAGILFFGTLPIFILTYAYTAMVMIFRAWLSQFKFQIKLTLMSTYTMVLILEILFCAQVTFGHHFFWGTLFVSRLFSTVMILLPLAVERIVIIHKDADSYLPSISELTALSFEQLKHNREAIHHSMEEAEHVRKTLAIDKLKTIFIDMKRHSSIRYVNNGTLTDAYFDAAKDALTDPYIYIIISNTGSDASEIISLFTQKQYNHTSLSFDRELKTIISYNGGNNVYPPGLNPEIVEAFHKKDDASVLVYRLPVTREQKKHMIDQIEQINHDGSAYNIVGLVVKRSLRPNIMFCSQFVYRMLESNGLAYFTKPAGNVKPTDFIELDYYKKTDFCYEIKF